MRPTRVAVALSLGLGLCGGLPMAGDGRGLPPARGCTSLVAPERRVEA